MPEKIKLAIAQGATCSGCDIAILDLDVEILFDEGDVEALPIVRYQKLVPLNVGLERFEVSAVYVIVDVLPVVECDRRDRVGTGSQPGRFDVEICNGVAEFRK